MKKIIRCLFLGILVLSFFSCSWELPERIAVKTNATYNFGIGTIKKDLSEYFDSSQILDSSLPVGMSSKIYDYYPDKINGNVQKFLFKIPIQEIAVDFSEYFNGTNIADSITDLSFKKAVTIPELKLTVEESIPDDVLKAVINASITAKGNTSALNFSGTFNTAEYSAGTLLVSLSNTSISGSVELYDANDNILCISPIYMGTAELPLYDAKLTKTGMKLVIPTGFGTYSAIMTPDSQLKKITEFSTSTPITVPINTKVSNGNNSNELVECVIETGKLDTAIEIPKSWTNVNVAYDLLLSGGISAVAKKKTGNSNSVVLDNVSITTAATNLSSNLELSFENSTVEFSEPVKIKASTDVSSYKKIGMVLSDVNISVNQSEKISSEMKTIIERIVLSESGLKGTYTNTFPEGNDITLTANSSFIGLSQSSQVLKGNTTTETPISLISSGEHTVKFRDTPKEADEYDKLDFAVDILLPGATPSEPKKIVISSVKPNSTYEISVSLEPDINWKEIVLYSSGVEQSNTISIGLNVSQMFSTFTSVMGGDFQGKLSIKSLPISIYAVKPKMSCFDNAKFAGDITMFFGSEASGTLVEKTEYGSLSFMENGEMNFTEMPELTIEDKTVISNLDRALPSAKSDLATIINAALDDTDGSIYVKYKLKFSNSVNSSQTFSIKKEEFDASGSTAPSIAILAFIEIPLEFNLSDDINMNLLSMAGITDSGTDLLQREGPPDEADKLEFLDAIRSVKINYSSSTLPFYGIPGVSLILDLDGAGSDVFEQQTLNLDGGVFELYDYNEMMSIYPLVPLAEIVLHKGTFSIPRKVGIETKISLAIEMDPNYEMVIFGGDK